MGEFFASAVIAVSFFTIIPMPRLEWVGKRMTYLPLMLPFIGAIVGAFSTGFFWLLQGSELSTFLMAAAMTAFYAVLTGGIHIDGLMDSSDGYFSRRDRERRLEIMKDSNVGAFAVITLFFVMLTKTAFVYEIFQKTQSISPGFFLVFALIPVISRTFAGTMIYMFPPAKANSLTQMYGNINKKQSFPLWCLLLAICGVLYFVAGAKALLIVVTAVVFYALYYFSSKKHFGGITGDLLGCFIELSEVFMMGCLAIAIL